VETEARKMSNRQRKMAKRAFNSYIPPEGQEETRAEEEVQKAGSDREEKSSEDRVMPGLGENIST
jgi:hypothetical protein